MYLFTCTGLQHEFYITRCWCYLTVKPRSATSRAGITHPSIAHQPSVLCRFCVCSTNAYIGPYCRPWVSILVEH